ncbi:MAG: mechanosensitive ion channel domain-containing protein, partial [Myxococcota bacterium]
ARTRLTEGTLFVSTRVFSYAVVFFVVLLCLQWLKLGPQGKTTLLLVLAIGVGFGLQNLASNFISGLILLFGRPISVGDHIELGSHFGRVKKIGTRSTLLELPTKRMLLIPNSHLLSSQVINWTTGVAFREKVLVEVAYGVDPKHVEEILIEVATRHQDIPVAPKPTVRLRELSLQSMIFSLSISLPSPGKRGRIRSDLRMEIHRRFHEEGIEFAHTMLPAPETAKPKKSKGAASSSPNIQHF